MFGCAYKLQSVGGGTTSETLLMDSGWSSNVDFFRIGPQLRRRGTPFADGLQEAQPLHPHPFQMEATPSWAGRHFIPNPGSDKAGKQIKRMVDLLFRHYLFLYWMGNLTFDTGFLFSGRFSQSSRRRPGGGGAGWDASHVPSFAVFLPANAALQLFTVPRISGAINSVKYEISSFEPRNEICARVPCRAPFREFSLFAAINN